MGDETGAADGAGATNLALPAQEASTIMLTAKIPTSLNFHPTRDASCLLKDSAT
jgi:hypothetical protein